MDPLGSLLLPESGLVVLLKLAPPDEGVGLRQVSAPPCAGFFICASGLLVLLCLGAGLGHCDSWILGRNLIQSTLRFGL